MGFDIRIEGTDIELGFSFNWGVFEDVWYIRRDMFGKTGREVAESCLRAIHTLQSQGVRLPATLPQNQSSNWWWGMQDDGDVPLPLEERKAVFMYYLVSFAARGAEHPDARFLNSDNQ